MARGNTPSNLTDTTIHRHSLSLHHSLLTPPYISLTLVSLRLRQGLEGDAERRGDTLPFRLITPCLCLLSLHSSLESPTARHVRKPEGSGCEERCRRGVDRSLRRALFLYRSLLSALRLFLQERNVKGKEWTIRFQLFTLVSSLPNPYHSISEIKVGVK